MAVPAPRGPLLWTLSGAALMALDPIAFVGVRVDDALWLGVAGLPFLTAACAAGGLAVAAAAAALWSGRARAAATLAACVEVAGLFAALQLVQGALLSKPVWGVWWSWSPTNVTTAAALLAAVLMPAFRRALPEARRTRLSAAAVLVVVAGLSRVYAWADWLQRLHSQPLRPELPLLPWLIEGLSAGGAVLLAVGLVGLRRRG